MIYDFILIAPARSHCGFEVDGCVPLSFAGLSFDFYGGLEVEMEVAGVVLFVSLALLVFPSVGLGKRLALLGLIGAVVLDGTGLLDDVLALLVRLADTLTHGAIFYLLYTLNLSDLT